MSPVSRLSALIASHAGPASSGSIACARTSTRLWDSMISSSCGVSMVTEMVSSPNGPIRLDLWVGAGVTVTLLSNTV